MSEPQVTTNAPAQPNAMGGAPTTTQDVNGAIQPNPTPAPAPTAPSAQPAAPTTSAPRVQPSATPATPPTPEDARHGIFKGVLRMLSGAPQFVTRTDPQTGETTRVPVQNTKGQLGKSILAGALAGMFGGMDARDPEGRHDPAKAAAQGFAAGSALHAKQQDQAQGQEDQNLARKQMVMATNLATAHQVLALNQGKQNMFEKIAANNKAGILKDAQTYDSNLTDAAQPKAILRTGLSHDEALAALKGNWSNQLAIQDGYTTDEKGDVTPTFSLLNPDVKVKMSDAQAKEFGRFNPQYLSALDQTGGDLRMSLHQYAATMAQYNSLEHMDALFGQEAKALGLKNTDFADAVKSIPNGMNAVIEAENAIGSGGTPIDALRRLSIAQGGGQILNKLGITGEKVQKLYEDQQAAEAHAKGASKEEIEANKLDAKEKLEAAKEIRKQQSLMGYVEDATGKLQYVSKYDVDNNPEKYSGQTFSEVKPSEVKKDRDIVKPLGDVQMKLNDYRSAVNNYDAAVKKGGIDRAHETSDTNNLNLLMSDTDVSEAAAHAGASGFGISIPTVALELEASKKEKLMNAYNALTPEGKHLADMYAQARASIPAYVKALTNSGRGSKEQLDIELKNFLPPSYNRGDVHNRIDGMQANLDNQVGNIPQNILGTRMPVAVVRTDRPPQGATGIVRDNKGNAVGFMVNGKPVDAAGEPLTRGR